MNIFIRILAAAALLALSAMVPVRADSHLPQIGGPGGAQYHERCPQGQVLATIKFTNMQVPRPAAANANRKAIIIVGGKPQEKVKQPTVQERVKAYQDQLDH